MAFTRPKNIIDDNLWGEGYYDKIYEWYKTNYPKIHETVSNLDYIIRSFNCIRNLPSPASITQKNIYPVLKEIVSGDLEWGFHYKLNNANEIGDVAKQIIDRIDKINQK